MTLPDVTKITVDCKECGGPLDVQIDDYPSPDWGWAMKVKPCETCLAEAEAAGEDAGCQEIDEEMADEIADLEATIGELNREIEELEAELADA